MSDNTLRTILELAGVLLTGLVMFVVGRRSERHHQLLLIRAEMLRPIEEWLGGAEKILQMVADTLASISQGSLLPATYDMEERRKTAQFMGESRAVFAILESGSLKIRQTKRLVSALKSEITELAFGLNELINMQIRLLELAVSQPEEALTVFVALGQLFNKLGIKVGRAYLLIAQIKTAFV